MEVIAILGKLTVVPANPLLNKRSIREDGSKIKCGSGSHTVPICSHPGLEFSNSCRALTRWETESL